MNRIEKIRRERDRLSAILDALENGTLEVVEERGEVTSTDVVEAIGCTMPAANQRLIRLVKVGVLERQRLRGDQAFIYRLAEGVTVGV